MIKEPRLRFTEEERADPALEKPIRKAEKAAVKADKAQAKIPKKQVKRAEVDPKTGKVTTKLVLEDNALSDQIKAAEKRMAEIAVLRTHIVNYAKTRETYVAYRKAGYSKKFRQEHEEEILLHQAAKEAFNELNVKKLPTIKELQTEYAQLLADKKKAYGE